MQPSGSRFFMRIRPRIPLHQIRVTIYFANQFMLSSVQSITESIWLNRYSGHNLVMFVDKAFSAHFDEAETHADKVHRIMTVSGFVSSVDKWKRFERDWPAILDKHGLPEGTLFHMKEFARNNGVYKIFKDNSSKKAALISDLLKCAHVNTRKSFSVSVVLRDYEAVDAKYEFHELHGYPYPFCGIVCVDAMMKWKIKNKIDGPVETFFESGATHWGQLETLVQKSHGFTPIKKLKQEMVQFQCADLIAWKNRRALELTKEKGHTRDEEILDSIFRSQKEVDKIPQFSGVYDKQGLLKICEQNKIKRR